MALEVILVCNRIGGGDNVDNLVKGIWGHVGQSIGSLSFVKR